ncbi:hypothetical protein [Mycobacterium rhizamassiliense]|nr:hypothetical protein [Mycobacterium rhizamassiliense]
MDQAVLGDLAAPVAPAARVGPACQGTTRRLAGSLGGSGLGLG